MIMIMIIMKTTMMNIQKLRSYLIRNKIGLRYKDQFVNLFREVNIIGSEHRNTHINRLTLLP